MKVTNRFTIFIINNIHYYRKNCMDEVDRIKNGSECSRYLSCTGHNSPCKVFHSVVEDPHAFVDETHNIGGDHGCTGKLTNHQNDGHFGLPCAQLSIRNVKNTNNLVSLYTKSKSVEIT